MKMQYAPTKLIQKWILPRVSFIMSARHFGEPEVSSGENAEHGSDRHYQMEVADHEVRGVQHDVDRRLGQERIH